MAKNRNSSKSPPPPKAASPAASAHGIIDPTPQLREVAQSMVSLRTEVSTLSKELRGVLSDAARTAIDSELRGRLSTELSEQLRAQLDQLSQSLQSEQQASVQRLDAHERRLQEQLTASQATVADAQARLSALSEDVLAQRLATAVSEATRAAAQEVYRREFGQQVEELDEAYEDAQSAYKRLHKWIVDFEPGGTPVLHQQLAARARQAEEQEAQLAELRDRLRKRTDQLQVLEAERSRERALSGIDPEDLRRKLDTIDTKARDLSEREALQAEVQRVKHELQTARAELQNWRGLDLQVQENEAEHQQLKRLRQQLDEARIQQDELEANRIRVLRERNLAREHVGRLERTLAELEADRAAAAERKDRLANLTAQVAELTRLHEQARGSLAKSQRELKVAEADRDALQRQVDAGESRLASAETEWRRKLAEEQRAQLEQERRELQEWADHTAARRAQIHMAHAEEAKDRIAQLEERLRLQAVKLQQAQHEVEVSRSAQHSAELHKQAAETTYIEHKARLELSITELRERLQAEADQELARLRERTLADLEQDRSELESEIRRLDQVLSDREQAQQGLAETLAELRGSKGVLEAELDKLQNQVEQLRPKALDPEERMAQLYTPWFTAKQLPPEGEQPSSETGWLHGLSTAIRDSGFTFHDRLLRAFHTSLKIAEDAPLTVLAGISGTGKSELPRLYAELGGLPFMELAVQPSWDSPHDLFGFFNYTDGQMKAEPLARLLQQVEVDEILRAGPLLVLLDEMNLARVEYYFAELLSKLEARRSALRSNTEDALRRASVLLDAGPNTEKDKLLFLDPRVHFVGTMNEDESTLSLSDKVLDRACVLTFPAPGHMTLREQTDRTDRRGDRLSWETWTSWKRVPESNAIEKKLNEINERMAALGRPFGHRLFRAIHSYVANYPSDGSLGTDAALSDQFAMKIIPRLRGLECGDRAVSQGLQELESVVPDDLRDAFGRACNREFFSFDGAASLYQVED